MYKWHERMYKQFVIWWFGGVKDGYGQAVWDYPLQSNCRWHPNTELMVNDKGGEFVSKAKVYIPDSLVISVGDYIKLGTIHDIDPVSGYDSDSDAELLSPENIDGAYKVLRVDKHPSLCNTITVQVVWV